MTTRRRLLPRGRGYGWRGCKCWLCTPKRRPEVGASAAIAEQLENRTPRVELRERVARGCR